MLPRVDIEQRIVITESQIEINSWIENGWQVVSVTAQHITGGHSFTAKGAFCFLIEKAK